MDKINIAMTTDENYILPTKVTISSILDAAERKVPYRFHILCSRKLDEGSRQKLIELERTYDFLNIIFHEIDGDELEHAVTTAHIPVASYYRLYMGRVIDEDRCLFVDGDMIIKEDLSTVYGMELEGCYAAGVRDMGVQSRIEEFSEYADYLGIDSMNEYVNAGFMLFDLKKIRDDGLEEAFVSAMSHGYKYMDQDIINKYCHGKIKLLPLRYDYFTEYDGSAECCQRYTDQELDGIDQLAVLHYTGFFKPWLCTRLRINRYWWNQAKKILKDEEYQKVLEQAHEFERKSDWSYIVSRAEKEKALVIFGFSEIGRNAADRLQTSGYSKIAAFADNNPDKHGMGYAGVSVLSAEDACFQFPNALWVISSQNGFSAIGRQLEALGVKKDRIIRYIFKDQTYYNRLDDTYREYELQMSED